MFNIIFKVMAVFFGLFLALQSPPALAQPINKTPNPFAEESPVRTDMVVAEGRHDMVAAANPLAVEAGRDMLTAGGSAVDAAIATQLVLGLVEPQSSGIGGGAFMLHYEAKTKDTQSYDGRETAPASVTENLFLGTDGKPRDFIENVVGGRAVGVPGMLRMMAMAHKAHGKLPWDVLFGPAIHLAENGFPISPRLYMMLGNAKTIASRFSEMHRHYYDSAGNPFPVGTKLRDGDYGRLLKDIAAHGPDIFYTGKFARHAVKAMAKSPVSPAVMTLADLADYKPVERKPVCGEYRTYKICSMGPPSSGATTMLATLKILERYDLAALGPKSAQAIHLISEAMSIAYADRDTYLADPAYGFVPVEGLIDSKYLDERAKLIDLGKAGDKVEAGVPPGADKSALASDQGSPLPSTSNISVVDKYGNVVEWTGTVQAPFGSFLRVDGVLLNNELTDFAFIPQKHGVPVANRVAPGKRPRSSMTPTLVFDQNGKFFLGIGSAGGSRIISHVVKSLIAILDWHLDPQQAIAQPNFFKTSDGLQIDPGPVLDAVKSGLDARGHKVIAEGNNSGITAIQAVYDSKGNVHYLGGADPRREGIAVGD